MKQIHTSAKDWCQNKQERNVQNTQSHKQNKKKPCMIANCKSTKTQVINVLTIHIHCCPTTPVSKTPYLSTITQRMWFTNFSDLTFVERK